MRPRITRAIQESELSVLKGNTHPLARAQFDRGAVPDGLAMNRMLMVLQRSPEQEQALQKLLDDQQDQSSPNYHKWLAPEDFGKQFGPADEDIQAVTGWLATHGFQVAQVNKGKTVIEFSGSAGQVREAFHTPIHKYVVEGEEHVANANDPQIPAALAPVVRGMLSLHNFRARPLLREMGRVTRSRETGAITASQPLFTIPVGNGCGVQRNDCYGLGPYDFATIYNVLPLWNAGINGAGQTIAIVGETDINPQDVTDFRHFFGLPPASLQVIHDGPELGILQDGEETESDLDVEWSGAVAPGATIDFVVAESTETTQGVQLSALHIIDNNLAPVMSESYGNCELFLGAAGNQFFAQLWQQAAAEGITVMLASGDSGSAVCDRPQAPGAFPVTHGLQVSGYASTPYNVAVGGTDFADLTNAASYWNTSNNSTTQASAKSYIPESTWNDSCTNAVFGTLLGFSADAETNCNNFRLVNFVAAVGGSGGKSSCISSDGQTASTCAGGYAKPSWQSSLTPNDGARDVPDVSLFAADGLAGSFYLICEADQSGLACNPNVPTADFLGIGGTSASSPAFAGIMALVNQQTGSRQGNANYVLYKLAAQQPSAFHDVATGTIAMPCRTGTTDCTTSRSGDAIGILNGYNAGAGYDLATGLGSVDAFNLVTRWNSVTLAPSVTTLSSLTPTTITHGQPVSVTVGVAPQSGPGTATGLVELSGGATGNVAEFDSHALTSGSATWTTSLLPGGSYNVIAHYAGDGNYSSSDSATSIPVVVNKENSTLVLGLETFDQGGHLISSNATSATYGSPYILRVNVTGTTCSSNSPGQAGCPTGAVTLTDNSNPLDAGAYTLNAFGYAEDQTIQLPGGTHAVQASYGGDNSFNGSSMAASLSIVPTQTNVQDRYPFPIIVDAPFTVTAGVQSLSSGAPPTGTVTFNVDGKALVGTLSTSSSRGGSGCGGNLIFVCLNATLSGAVVTTPGAHNTLTTYSGDSNYAPSVWSYFIRTYYLTTTSIVSDPPSPQRGASLTLTALIDTTEKGTVPTGTVTFQDPRTQSAIPGNVTLSPVTDASGNSALQASMTYILTGNNATLGASYSGDGNFRPSASNALTISVPGNDFDFQASPQVTVPRGSFNSVSLFIDGQASYQGTVNFTPASCSGLPAEASCRFDPPSITGTGDAFMYIQTTAAHAMGTQQAKSQRVGFLWGTGTATVAGILGLILFASPSPRRGHRALSLFLLAFLMTLSGCGGGGTGVGGGGSGGGGGGGGSTDPGTPTGTYTVTVTASSGSITHTAKVTLIVQ